MCLLDAAGVGVSAVLGLGGRDLSAEVGGRSARTALARLDDDPATELIVVVSKVAAGLPGTRTPVRFADLGDLTAAVEGTLRDLGVAVPDWPRWPGAERHRRRGSLVGLFAGGTLCAEAAAIVGPGHPMTDFGDDRFTVGRPHPMIDQTLRLEALAAALADPATGAVLLDVVLGYGAHPDPAAELAPAIAGAEVRVVASLVGTQGDPQGLDRQAAALAAAGGHVFTSNAQAARFARDLVA
jgi:FdrA protein